MRLMRLMGVMGLLAALSRDAGPAQTPVYFSMRALVSGGASGASLNRMLVVTPTGPWLTDGTNLYGGGTIMLQPRGGLVTNWFRSADYYVDVPGLGRIGTMSVPPSGGPYNAATLITNLVTYCYTNRPGAVSDTNWIAATVARTNGVLACTEDGQVTFAYITEDTGETIPFGSIDRHNLMFGDAEISIDYVHANAQLRVGPPGNPGSYATFVMTPGALTLDTSLVIGQILTLVNGSSVSRIYNGDGAVVLDDTDHSAQATFSDGYFSAAQFVGGGAGLTGLDARSITVTNNPTMGITNILSTIDGTHFYWSRK